MDAGDLMDDGWWLGKGFWAKDDHTDRSCKKGHLVPFTLGHILHGMPAICPVCGEVLDR